VELQPGSGGIYIITAADQLIFSKKQEGRFPAPEEIINKLRQLL
jgi:selenoprotein W-related protein